MARRRVSLVACAQSLSVHVLLLQLLLPLPVSSATFRPPPKLDSFSDVSPARYKEELELIEGLIEAAGEVAQRLLPDSSRGGGGNRVYDDTAPAVTAGLGLLVVHLLMGTPPQNISGVLDISTQLVWTHCQQGPSTLAPAPAPASFFQLNASQTARWLRCGDVSCHATCNDPARDPCSYHSSYGGMYLANDTFTFDGTPVPGLLFGCNASTTARDHDGGFGLSGVIGMSRGPLSLLSQLGLSNFSYLLAPEGSGRGNEFRLGGDVIVAQTGNRNRSRTTRLLTSPAYPHLYYRHPAGTFDLRGDGSVGVILSTTVPVTYLREDAYRVVRQAFARRIPVGGGSSSSLGPLCYTAQSMAVVKVPRLTLLFQGVDEHDAAPVAALELGKANYFFSINDRGGRRLECLSVLPSSSVSLLGSLVQTGTRMVYDLHAERLTFVTEEESSSSSSLSSSQASPVMVSAKQQQQLAMVAAVAAWVLLGLGL
ncbi:hypothetical protein BS78_08G005500 [Paspalum vaginatum]|nr:hypothetical protein BS78_08G005500 [Paspalum vaginatum]